MSDLKQLRHLAEIRYLQQRDVFAEIQKQEEALRAELKRISDLDEPISADGAQLGEMRAIGADVLWRGWLARSRTSLNLQLARVLARKSRELDQVRRAYGKVAALDALIQDQTRDRRKVKDQRQLEAAITLALRERL